MSDSPFHDSVDTRQRITRTKAQWQALITEFEYSDLSVRRFCEQQALTPSSFYLWRKRLGQPDRVIEATADEAFMPLDAPVDPTNHWDVELAIGTDVVLRLRRA